MICLIYFFIFFFFSLLLILIGLFLIAYDLTYFIEFNLLNLNSIIIEFKFNKN